MIEWSRLQQGHDKVLIPNTNPILENDFCSHLTKRKVIENIFSTNTGETELAFAAIQFYVS